jgi:nucleotide-binding universal stress UspA family protein
MHLSTVVRLARIKEQTQEWAGEYLERLAADARKQGVAVQKATFEGRPNAAILQFAEANQEDLIVICTRGRSGFRRWLMGSVADRVVRGTTVPVLLVRAAKEKMEA